MNGLITEIERFALKDGPGIRTTVFLQGCNMACSWCHNPETISTDPKLMYFESKCIHCRKCMDVCPTKALETVNGERIFNRDLCTACGACTNVCFTDALSLSCHTRSGEQVFSEILQDKDYYLNSNGGITISGGEVFMQFDFSLWLLKKCKEAGIATAIETNLNTSREKLKTLLPFVDIVMCDIKLLDSKMHRKWTGVDNQKTLDNIRYIFDMNKPAIVRTPIIPGVNNTPMQIGEIAGFLSSLKGNLL